ncbi:MAG: plasmid pRiA4b ORF-3 family protein [Gaiellaceae bacterium]
MAGLRAYAFRAELAGHPGVVRTVAIRDDQTLEQLHEALRLAFGWFDPHLYSFWIGGDFWDRVADEYTAPFELEERGERACSARVPIAELGPKKGARLAYVFDFGDEWRVRLKIVDTWEAEDEAYPMLVEAEGAAPPQYADAEDED